jgi:indole-3-glycerol phosphate synthase
MPEFLAAVCASVRQDLENGYYNVERRVRRERLSLRSHMSKRRPAIIAELKAKSPSRGHLREAIQPALANELVASGAAGLSVLTQRAHFDGSISLFQEVAESTRCPLLFKDFIVSERQIDAAFASGADIVLLISELFHLGLSDLPLEEMVDYSHGLGLETLVEFHSPSLMDSSVSSESDYIGVNNRNLKDLSLDTNHFFRIAPNLPRDRLVVAESGYSECADILRDFRAGADAFLIGSSLMESPHPGRKLKELASCG